MTAMLSGTQHAVGRRPGVKNGLTPRRSTRVVENDEFGAFTSRVLAAHGRRVATGDIEGLRDLDALGQAWDQAMHAAIDGLRADGFSWAEIGDRLGITRQAAHQRWGSPGATHSSDKGQD